MNPRSSANLSNSVAAESTAAEPVPPDCTSTVPMVEEALARPELCRKARAVLLLRTCQFAQVLRQDVLRHYWPKLLADSSHLPVGEQEAFQALRAAVEPPHPAKLGQFAQQIVADAERATGLAASDREAATRLFSACEERLRKRWWPFGKAPVWNVLVQRWAETDREAGLQRLRRLRRAMQENLLKRLHDQKAMEAADWDRAWEASGVSGGTLLALSELLDRENPNLQISDALAGRLGAKLLERMHVTSADQAESRKLERECEKAFQRYLKLVGIQAGRSATGAEQLMETLFLDQARLDLYQDDWPKRFTQLRQVIRHWTVLPGLIDAGGLFLRNSAPPFLRDFALTCWHAALVDSEAKAPAAWSTLESLCADKMSAEAWFLVTLVRRGLPAGAMQMALASERSGDLAPRVRRAWLCEDPASAKTVISPDDLSGDLIGAFLLLGSTRERVEFLRRETDHGRRSLPDPMWLKPTVLALLPDHLRGQEDASAEKCLLHLYSKNEAAEKQFKEYVHLFGYHNYGYEDLDPYLLATLLAWDEMHPGEVEQLLKTMHQKMQPDDFELTTDVLRNCIFNRYQNVFPARPAAFDELFVRWLKRTLVDSSVQNRVGDTVYTLSLKEIVPFLYCLIGAEKLARVAPARCDELLTRALCSYKADADLMTSAAQLFASDKGLSALQPPAPIKDSSLREDWQVGAVAASCPRLLKSLATNGA